MSGSNTVTPTAHGQADSRSSVDSGESTLSMQSLGETLPGPAKAPKESESAVVDEAKAEEEDGGAEDAETGGAAAAYDDPVSRALRDYSLNLAKYTASRFEDTDGVEGVKGKKSSGEKEEDVSKRNTRK